MSDRSTEPAGTDPTGAGPEPTDTAEPEPAEQPEQPDDDGPGREAAKYRRQLRATEAERDGIASRLTSLQRAEAERLAGQQLASGQDLWLAGTELSTLLDGEGNISAELVAAAASKALEDRPHWQRRAPAAAPASAVTASGRITDDEPVGKSWSDILSRNIGSG